MPQTGSGMGTPITQDDIESTCACCPEDPKLRPSIGLEDFRTSVYLPPYGFWQQGQNRMYYPGTLIPIDLNVPCESAVFDTSATGSLIVGRDDVFDTIRAVDLRMLEYTGYWPRPQFSCYEWSPKSGYTGGRIRLPFAKLKAIGKETLTPLVTIPLDDNDITDDDGDGILDTITIVTPVVPDIPASELIICFVQDDWRKNDLYRNEIRPITVVVDGDDWRITFPSWLAIKPKLFSGLNRPIIDPQDTTAYATEVDLIRRWADPSQAITIMRQNVSCTCDMTNSDCYVCENGSACIINAERGLIELKFTPDASCFCPKCISRICINYFSGGSIDTNLIARLVAGYLGREVCCNGGTPMLKYWQQDFVGTTERGQVVSVLNDVERANPFGTSRGGIDAFRFLRAHRATKAARI